MLSEPALITYSANASVLSDVIIYSPDVSSPVIAKVNSCEDHISFPSMSPAISSASSVIISWPSSDWSISSILNSTVTVSVSEDTIVYSDLLRAICKNSLWRESMLYESKALSEYWTYCAADSKSIAIHESIYPVTISVWSDFSWDFVPHPVIKTGNRSVVEITAKVSFPFLLIIYPSSCGTHDHHPDKTGATGLWV